MITVQERELRIWEKNHLEDCANKGLFKEKDVLEVGGIIPYSYTRELGVNSWTCIDKVCEASDKPDYKIVQSDIATANLPDNSYDTIIATNSFEHIHNLETAFSNMHRMLRPDGTLSALFGPIWSSAKGHHLYVWDERGKLFTFNDPIIPQWGHLLYSKEEMREMLKPLFSPSVLDRIISSVYTEDEVNQRFFEEYEEMVNNSKFEILEFRNWHQPIEPDEETLKKLQAKHGYRNFSTVSIKILLKAKK